MTTREAEARQYFAALTALPTEPWTLLASSLRAKLPPPLRDKLPTPGTIPIASAKRDLDALLDLPGPAGDAAVAIWIEVAVERLGRHADLVRARLSAARDPGRDPSLAAVAEGVERTKFEQRDDLVLAAWIDQARAAADAVAYVEVPRRFGTMDAGLTTGTAFLVGPDLLMTAYHVVEARDRPKEAAATAAEVADQLARARFAFNYTATTSDPTPRPIGTFLTGADLVWSDPALDVAVVKLRQPAPTTAAPVRFHTAGLPAVDGGFTFVANIIQHPAGEPKQLGLRNNAVWKVDDARLYYFTDTRGGSSGAPVFNDAWAVIAVHTGWEQIAAGANDAIYLGRRQAVVNRGTRASKIAAALPASVALTIA